LHTQSALAATGTHKSMNIYYGNLNNGVVLPSSNVIVLGRIILFIGRQRLLAVTQIIKQIWVVVFFFSRSCEKFAKRSCFSTSLIAIRT